MKSLLILLVLVSPNYVFGGDPASDADTLCREKWTKAGQLDQSMYNYCVNQQSEGLAESKSYRQKYGSHPWFKDYVEQQCISKWTKTGVTSQDMVAYCYKQQLEGYNELKYQSTLANYNSALAETCFDSWSKKNDGDAFNMGAYCYKDKSKEPDLSLPPKLKNLFGARAVATVAAPPTASSATARAQNSGGSDLVGFDLKLSPNEFRKTYADKIKSCRADKYANKNISATFTVPIYVCDFKAEGGAVKFFATGGKYHVYKFVHSFPQKGVKMRVAAKKLEEKVGAVPSKETYTSNISVYCAAEVDFFGGKAVIISANIFSDIILRHGRAAASHLNCTDDFYLSSEAESVQYDNADIVTKMDEAIAIQRLKTEDEKGKDIKL